MKLKYYLRGIGIGIVITTIIFMISISLHKNESEPQNVPQQDAESKTVADLDNSMQNTEDISTEDTELPEETEKEEKKETETKTNTETKTDSETKPNANQNQDVDKTVQQEQKNENSQETKSTEEKTETEKVRFEIKGGEYSDTVCRKLAEAGLIDNAEAFNQYLVEKDYDNLILPGIYDIPKDSTYEEIAVLLTAKVE